MVRAPDSEFCKQRRSGNPARRGVRRSELCVYDVFSFGRRCALRIIGFYGPMFAMWGAASFVVSRRSGRFIDAITTGVIVGAVTIAVFHISGMLRINVLLSAIVQRADWHGLAWSFPDSGFESLRAYANYTYAKELAPKLIAGRIDRDSHWGIGRANV
jgi:hypothetical protein